VFAFECLSYVIEQGKHSNYEARFYLFQVKITLLLLRVENQLNTNTIANTQIKFFVKAPYFVQSCYVQKYYF
jgi:hypothetical protein